MRVIPHDHILRFRFESETRPDIGHVVDLGGYAGFGECSCEDFCFRVRPVLAARTRNGLNEFEDVKRCKHLVAAREHLLRQLIERVTEGERGLT